MSKTLVAVAVIALAGCTRAPKRPATAMALCEQLSKKYFAAEKCECGPVTEPEELTLLQAIEAARLSPPGQTRAADTRMFVSYRTKLQKGSLGGLLQAAARELTFALPMIEAGNDGASVSVWVERGKMSAADFEQLQKEIAAFTPDEPTAR